jgi:multidrug efflux system outer membrane protein
MSTMNPSTLLKTSAALLAASALAGCMQLAPRYERPAAPVPATFPNATSVPSGTAAADLTWQDYFADPALRALIELALKNNRDLRVAVLNIEAVRAQYQLRRADQLPTLNAGLTASRAPGTGGNNVSAYSAGLSVAAYEVDLFGRVRSLTDSAAAQVLASEESRRVVQISLIASVANQYLALAADEELLDLTLRTLDTREQSLKLTQLRFDNGAASELDLRQAQTLAEGRPGHAGAAAPSARTRPQRAGTAARPGPARMARRRPAGSVRSRSPMCPRACPPRCCCAAPTWRRPSSNSSPPTRTSAPREPPSGRASR